MLACWLVGVLIYDILLSGRRAHIPRTQPAVVCMRSVSFWEGAGIIWIIRADDVFRELRQGGLAGVSPHYSRSCVASLLRWRIYSRGSTVGAQGVLDCGSWSCGLYGNLRTTLPPLTLTTLVICSQGGKDLDWISIVPYRAAASQWIGRCALRHIPEVFDIPCPRMRSSLAH